MNLFSKSDDAPACVLGLMVAARSLQGVLLTQGEGGLRVVRHLTRPRHSDDSGGHGHGFDADLPAAVPEQAKDETSGSDFTIQFGGGDGTGGNLFLGSEFGDLEGGAGGGIGSQNAPAPFDAELMDMLSECRDAGFEDVEVAFCLQAADVSLYELRVVDEAAGEGAQSPTGATPKKKLFKLLDAQYDGVLPRERVAFLPMTPTEEGVPRYAALIGEETDPVVSTLRALRSGDDGLPAVRLLDTELSLYLGLARAAQSEEEPAEDERTLVVRAGADDTFVVFMQGGVLQQHETLPLTAHDAPETICSRVLLLQDEYGIGEVERVLLMSDDQEEAFAESFEMFFTGARVSALRGYLPGQGSDEAFEAPGAIVPATGVALRLARAAGYQTFDDVNLLSKKLLRRRLRVPVSTLSLALAALVLCALAFFAFRYAGTAAEIEERRQRVQSFPAAEVDADPRRLQASIDSLQAISNRYTRGLEVLDELLMGSDKWSQALAEISRETAAVRGVWVDAWTPRQSAVELSGSATTRDRIVDLAERTDGSIEAIAFSEVRDWPVYTFTMTMPLETGLPEATRYLRKQALAESADGEDADSEDAGASETGPPTGTVNPTALSGDGQ